MSDLSSFQTPERLYTLRTNSLYRKLNRLYTMYMNGRLIKSQVNLQGRKYIQEHTELLKADVYRWLSKNRQGVINPKTFTDIDGFERDKIREWDEIVNDM